MSSSLPRHSQASRWHRTLPVGARPVGQSIFSAPTPLCAVSTCTFAPKREYDQALPFRGLSATDWSSHRRLEGGKRAADVRTSIPSHNSSATICTMRCHHQSAWSGLRARRRGRAFGRATWLQRPPHSCGKERRFQPARSSGKVSARVAPPLLAAAVYSVELAACAHRPSHNSSCQAVSTAHRA